MTKEILTYGPANGHVVGIVLKEILRRAMSAARSQLREFEVRVKGQKLDGGDDIVTTVDIAAQEIYLKSLRECFPHIGVIAEEDACRIPSDKGFENCWITVDPVDGTSALKRRQSHGIGTMLSFVLNGKIISAWVGDIMSNEIYGYRPDSSKVHRIRDLNHAETLTIDPRRLLKEQYVLLRDNPLELHSTLQSIITKHFKDIEVSGGSIGVGMARLWKGEVGAALLMPAFETPWDSLPIIGISQKLGFVFLGILLDIDLTHTIAPYTPPITPLTHRRWFPTLVVHESRLAELGIQAGATPA